jgi:hypothetical protein
MAVSRLKHVAVLVTSTVLYKYSYDLTGSKFSLLYYHNTTRISHRDHKIVTF